MLDQATKRRIDTARDILVGKVPDPKSQVEQITIALIYKFMDDMDAESEELGGQRKFFANGFSQYGWAKLMHSGLGGHETLNLYADAITKMPENPGIPALFREIFKNAYLPYRDPETLRQFLKIIDEFNYDHSEKLGDAFEYLLSVLGSQGDAGQFRTPRHIIDFMVEVVDPKKNETILDPACGTAGFLISAYKHILKANTKDGVDTLTPDEKGRLVQNIRGYDISPDMVRLSLVNLYLHGFPDPHAYEYDTLTSMDRWNELADVILANPPFMSPKGGIRPHNRFSVQSNRSEVLFVDYMAEHLTPNGRAGIIVPEGIIFQSQTAYKTLRKMLVEQYLVAVVSLPAGVFNPYSGVKTSILILDKSLAKQSDTIGFFKVENDGFGLGAQRRPIEKNDLPIVLADIEFYLDRVRSKLPPANCHLPTSLVAPKEKIEANGDYNLSGDRYRENGIRASSYPLRALGDLLEIQSGFPFKSEQFDTERGFPIIRIRDIKPSRTETKYVGEYAPAYVVRNGDLLIGMDGEFNCVVWQGGDALLNQRVCRLHSFKGCVMEYVARLIPLKLKEIEDGTYAVTVKHISAKQIAAIEIPLPPLDVQKEIVAEIEGYQKVIDGARAVVDNYRPHIPINPEWPMVEVGQVLRKSEISVLPQSLSERVTYVGLENISQGTGELCGATVTDDPADIKSLKNVFNAGDILYGKLRPNLNKVWLSDRAGICSTDILVLQPVGDEVITGFYSTVLRSESFNEEVMSHIKGAQLPRVGWSSLASIHVPLPPLAEQEKIVAEIEAEQRLVGANRDLIQRMERKVAATLARIWGEESSRPGPVVHPTSDNKVIENEPTTN